MKTNMSITFKGKYVYDASGKIVEVILPIHEFRELQRKASHKTGKPSPTRYEIPGELSASEMTRIADRCGAFDWLEDEPDIYSEEDGEPV
jgi:hypothetical protein